MVKAVKYTFRGMNQDITNDKVPVEYYYEANNIRFLTSSEVITGGVAFEKGNDLKVTIPTVTVTNNVISYNNKTLVFDQSINNEISNLPSSSSSDNKIIGHAITRNSTILFTTDNAGFDCIWEVANSDYDLTLLYLNNLEFNTSNPIQTLFNYENENIQKVYWIDGKNQIRALNIKHEQIEGNGDLINIFSNTLNFVANVEFSQPTITQVGAGGNHTSGVIQYAYNLYRLNSSQTKISPLSELVTLDKGPGQGGGDVNETVGATPTVVISDIDTTYTHIKVYAIKYTSFNQTPSINLIDERELGSLDTITLFDDGTTIETLTLEEFIFLGSNPIIPQHIESKDNILFPINLKENFFDLTIDCRSYAYPISQTSTIVWDNVVESSGVPAGDAFVITAPSTYDSIPQQHDAVNIQLSTRKYQYNSTTLGGSGKYIEYEIVQKALTDPEEYRLFKDGEIYRIGIQFYNRLGQITPAKWIADFQAPTGNLSGNYNTLKVTLTTDFDTWLADDANFATEDERPIGYKVIRAERNLSDRTIIDQGIVVPMMFQVKGEEAKDKEQFESTLIRESFQDGSLKIPSYLSRTFTTHPVSPSDDNGVLQEIDHLHWLGENVSGLNEGGEIYTHTDQNKLSQTFLHTKMMQFYSPEVLFDVQTAVPAGLRLKVKGIQENVENGIYGKELKTDTQLELFGGRTLGGLNPQLINSTEYLENNDFKKLFRISGSALSDNKYAFIGPSGAQTTMDFYQWYRQYQTFTANTNTTDYEIYGSPEVSVRGAGSTFYNNDPNFNYANSLQSFISDGNNDDEPISSINSYGSKNATIVLGTTTQTTNNRKSIEDMYNESSLSSPNGILITEITRSDNYKYLGGIYGGNSFEDKKRTTYLEIGEYQSLLASGNEVQIDSPGDTFVQEFKFLRIGKTDTEVYSNNQMQLSEVVSYVTESTVDLKNRSDISLSSWDARFQPRDDEFHSYNRVYSQEPSLVSNNAFDFTFKRIKNFDTRVVATKTKIPNETVDSWTDLLENTSLDLDGKYGPINGVINFKDDIYTYQDNAFAILGINPRVQTQGTDGFAIELGTGATLYDYQYISTRSGCINKWGIIASNSGIYYLDGLNKAFLRFSPGTQGGLTNLSDSKGMHKYLTDNLDVDNLRLDNPLLSTGVSVGYDQINNDIYLTYNNTWTLCFNEALDAFTGFYSYNSPIYIYNKEKLLTLDVSNSETIYETHAGDYNMFYGVNEASRLVFILNPEADHECIFNNLEYKSEAYNSQNVEQRYTWENVRAYNEFQDSGTKVLDTTNLRKLNRKYRLALPRHAGSTDRIRNNWAFVELTANNANKYRYLNHDIILYYVPNYIAIQ